MIDEYYKLFSIDLFIFEFDLNGICIMLEYVYVVLC